MSVFNVNGDGSIDYSAFRSAYINKTGEITGGIDDDGDHAHFFNGNRVCWDPGDDGVMNDAEFRIGLSAGLYDLYEEVYGDWYTEKAQTVDNYIDSQGKRLFECSQPDWADAPYDKWKHDIEYGAGYLMEWLDEKDGRLDGKISKENAKWFEQKALAGEDIDFCNNAPPAPAPAPAPAPQPDLGPDPKPNSAESDTDCNVPREKKGSALNQHYNQYRSNLLSTGNKIADQFKADAASNNGEFTYTKGATGYDLKDLFAYLIEQGYTLKSEYKSIIKAVIAAECAINGEAGKKININDYLVAPSGS